MTARIGFGQKARLTFDYSKVWENQWMDYIYDEVDRLQFYVKSDRSVIAYDWCRNGNMIARTDGNQTTQFEYDYDN